MVRSYARIMKIKSSGDSKFTTTNHGAETELLEDN